MGERRITCAEGWAKWDSRLRSLAQRGKKKKKVRIGEREQLTSTNINA